LEDLISGAGLINRRKKRKGQLNFFADLEFFLLVASS